MGVEFNPVAVHVLAEMARQDTLKAQGRFARHCGDDDQTDMARFCILAEEFGEVARAVVEINGLSNDHKGDADLRKELIQTAACCMKWVEGIDRRSFEEARKAGRSRT